MDKRFRICRDTKCKIIEDEKNSQLIRNELNKTEEKINKLVDAPEYGYTYDDNVVKVEDESAEPKEAELDTRIDFLG